MAYLASGTLGLMAGMLALGAVHVEVSAGNGLLGPAQRGEASLTLPARAVEDALAVNVDRAAKGDRAAAVKPAGGTTMSFQVPGIPDTSVMMRVPSGWASDARDALRQSPAAISGSRRGSSAAPRPVACEPTVSVLTAVARHLEPGRCVT